MVLRPLAGLLALSGGAAFANGAEFAPVNPLNAEVLYSKRLRFSDGAPVVSIGVAEGRRRVRLGATGPVRIAFELDGVPHALYRQLRRPFEISIEGAEAAETRHWVVVKGFPYGADDAAQEEATLWRARGLEATLLPVGGVLALSGRVLDTRELLVGVGGFVRRAEAAALQDRLSRTRGVKGAIHEALEKRPRAWLVFRDPRDGRRYRVRDSLFFGTVEGGAVSVDGVSGRGEFAGHMYVVVGQDGRLAVVNSVSAEHLLRGLVPAEIFPTAPLAALKAQAVTARGAIFAKLARRHFRDPFHLCAKQHCQVYRGVAAETASTDRAVSETHGMLSVRPRNRDSDPLELVPSVYSASCGGHTEANEVVWGNRPNPSLRGRLDVRRWDPVLQRFRGGITDANIEAWLDSHPPTACASSRAFGARSVFRWQRRVSLKELGPEVEGLGPLRDVVILGRGQGGRVTGVRLVGRDGRRDVLRELPVRKFFGGLRSGMFVMQIRRDAAGQVASFDFKGGGWGHGVGMCQLGAIGLAEQGYGFREILSHYYHGAEVVQLYRPKPKESVAAAAPDESRPGRAKP